MNLLLVCQKQVTCYTYSCNNESQSQCLVQSQNKKKLELHMSNSKHNWSFWRQVFQAIDCIDIDNQVMTQRKHTKHKQLTLSQLNRP